MKILSLSTCQLDPTLGSGKTRLRWSEGLRRLGHRVDVVEPKDFETFYGQDRARRFRQAWGAYAFLKRKLRECDYDAVESFGGEFGIATWRLSKLPDRPLIIAHTDGLELLATEREHAYNPPADFAARMRARFSSLTHERLSRANFVYADAFVALSELDREFVLGLGLYPRERTAVVEPGLDKEYLAAPVSSERQNRVAYVGSWVLRKGVGTLTEVMTRVLARDQSLRFDVYGTGVNPDLILASFPAELRQRISVYPRLANQELAEGLSKAKVFFFPTQYEGFGMALAEAMACGCAPVTTRTGFGATLLDGKEALLCDFTDAPAMERAVLKLLRDDALRARIATSAVERVRSLSWETNIAKLEALFARWTSEHRRSRDSLTMSALRSQAAPRSGA